jgi:predicted cation transporter
MGCRQVQQDSGAHSHLHQFRFAALAPNVITLFLAIIMVVVVLLGPILVKPVERNIELFFLVAGIVTALVFGQFSYALVRNALREPIELTAAVLLFGIVFRLNRVRIDRLFTQATRRFGQHRTCFVLTLAVGLSAGFITAVVAALIFAEAIALLKMDRSSEIAATVLGCFAIGIGAITTPLGMPASTLVLAALHADFWYLARLLGPLLLFGIVIVAIPSLFICKGSTTLAMPLAAERDSWAPILVRSGKVYIFIVGLVGLSAGIRPVVDAYVRHLPAMLLFWLNTISAVVDNATLAAVEIGPALSIPQQRFAIMGLLVSGGMLIPGNIPNIVAAGRLQITSREWAGHGLRTGAFLLIFYFALLLLLNAL